MHCLCIDVRVCGCLPFWLSVSLQLNRIPQCFSCSNQICFASFLPSLSCPNSFPFWLTRSSRICFPLILRISITFTKLSFNLQHKLIQVLSFLLQEMVVCRWHLKCLLLSTRNIIKVAIFRATMPAFMTMAEQSQVHHQIDTTQNPNLVGISQQQSQTTNALASMQHNLKEVKCVLIAWA